MPFDLIVLSHHQARPLLEARAAGARTQAISLDLNLSLTQVELGEAGVRLPDGQRLPWSEVEQIAGDENTCFFIEDGEAIKIQFFSEFLNRAYTLYPTESAPTMLVSGLPMHRIKGTNPREDTLAKIKAAQPVGQVLDTAMGLGYTAIAAARRGDVEAVTTVELDPAVLKICSLNPWSQELFDNKKIERTMGDALEVISSLEDGRFSTVVHDPPTFSLAGHLYSLEFYEESYRVLTRTGRLFHYIGDLQSRSGAGMARGVRQRLRSAGFERIVDRKQAFGVVAYKQ
jgi:predicted methyltransferase